MIRRSRISVRPNVKPTGRALTTSRDASQDNTQALADSAPSKGSEVTEDVAKTDPPIAAPEQTNQEAAQSSSCDNHTEATSHAEDAASKSSESQATTSTAVTSGTQRRKRFTALPNLAKPRVTATSSRTPKSPPKSPVKPVTSIEPQKITPTGESTHQTSLDNESVRIPRTSGRRRPSGGGRPPKAQPIPEPLSQSNEETQDAGTSEDTVVQLTDQQDESRCPLKTSQPDPLLVQESPTESLPLPEKDTFIQHENNSGPPPEQSQPDPSGKLELQSSSKVLTSLKALNDPADMLRLAKARKLRELLRKEMNKDKEEKKKPKMGFKERKAPKDHTKMTMRELIYYLPATNPMKSFSEEDQRSSEIVLPNSPKPTSSKASAGPSAQEERTRDVGHQEEEDERIDENQPEEEEPLLVPRVKVAEDGSLIIDEESLTVQVARAKGPNPAEDRDPIFERGSTTTYSSFRKGTYTKPWSNGETEMFYLAISMVGTDFSMIGQLFPHRARVEIKNKFKKEERANSWRIDKAFKEKRRLDLEFFKKLMEQILKDEEKKKKKNKDLAKAQRKPRAAKRKEIETSEGSDSDVVAGEKENEELSTDGGSDVTPKKRKGKGAETSQKRIKKRNAKALSEDPEDSQNLASEGLSSDDGRLKESHSSENMSKSPGIKPAQLTGRPQRPLPTLSRRWGNRRPELKKNLEKGASDGEEGRQDRSPKMSPVLNQEREKKQATLLHELEDVDEESDLTSVQEHIFNKPTRSGRIPKLSQHVMQAAAEEEEDEDELSDLPVSSKVRGQGLQASSRRAKLKPGPSLKRDMPRTGKSRLVTLRASRTEDDEDEEEDVVTQSQDDFSSNPEEENQVFVPMSLRPQLPVNSEVVETMEELDISLNVPDILGTSQNALCPELSCEQAVMPAGSVLCENQLDLLVDVIEFLEPEPMEVCKETSNEAAQTLLTIGNSAQIMQAAGLPSTDENDHVEESSSLIQQEVIQQEVINTDLVDHLIVDASTMICGPSISCETENKSHVDLLTCESHCLEPPSEEATTSIVEPIKIKTIDTVPDTTPHETQNMAASVQSTPPSRRGRLSKPKPNVGQSLRTRRGQQQEVSPELVTDSVGNSGAPCETEQVKNPTEPMEEPHALDYLPQDSSTVPTDVMQPATLPERGEDITDVFPDRLIEADQESALLKGKNNDIVTEERKDEQKEKKELDAKLEQQQTNSVSVSQSKSQEPSKSVRRCRGPKPKPNLTQKSRPTHTQTQQSTSTSKALNEKLNSPESAEVSTVTYSKSPEESAVVTAQSNISQSTIQQETEALDGEPFEAIKIITTQVVSEDKSRQKTVVMSEENTRNTPEEVLENTPVELPGCVLENTPADPVPDEPVFIISLTEIPPTIDERTGFEPKPLPPTAELHSNGQSANETEKTSRKVSHLLITDTLGPVSEEQEKEREIQTEEETRRRELKRKTPASTSQGSKAESQAEHHVEELERPVVEETENEKEHLEKKRKLPERTRRAKLQVKPNPVSRRNTRGTLAKEKTPEPSFEQTTSRPISTQETISVSETILLASISENSDLSTSTIISDTETTRENPPIPVPTQPTSNLIGSPQFASQDNAPQESGQEGCSQGTVNQVDVPGKEAVELAATEASGSRADSEDVHQITPVATPGPLTRPGRKPKGFLSFISSKNTQGSPGAHLRAKPGPQKPAVNTARPERKRLTPSIATTTIKPASAVQQPLQTPVSTCVAAIENSGTEEEPTSVSKYFFSDIFTEVDELEDME